MTKQEHPEAPRSFQSGATTVRVFFRPEAGPLAKKLSALARG